MIVAGSWVLATCGLVVIGIGLFFIFIRAALLPEDRRFIGGSADTLDAVRPGLDNWLKQVFRVMGGYMIASGLLTIQVSLTTVRDVSSTALIAAAAAGVASVGLMVVVNFRLRSDFRLPLVLLAFLWAVGILLAAIGGT